MYIKLFLVCCGLTFPLVSLDHSRFHWFPSAFGEFRKKGVGWRRGSVPLHKEKKTGRLWLSEGDRREAEGKCIAGAQIRLKLLCSDTERIYIMKYGSF